MLLGEASNTCTIISFSKLFCVTNIYLLSTRDEKRVPNLIRLLHQFCVYKYVKISMHYIYKNYAYIDYTHTYIYIYIFIHIYIIILVTIHIHV